MKRMKEDTKVTKAHPEYMPEGLDFSSVHKPKKRQVPTRGLNHSGKMDDSDQNNYMLPGDKMLSRKGGGKDPLDGSSRPVSPPKVKFDIDFSRNEE